MTLHARWLGTVAYAEALDLQRSVFAERSRDYLLLMEHRHTITMGRSAHSANVLVNPEEIGIDLVSVDRGGDVTYHGPGQLVGYPILTIADHGAGRMPSTGDYILEMERALIAALADLGVPDVGILEGLPGIWVDAAGERPRKLGAIGVKISRGRTMHGFSLNVSPDMAMFGTIVPCGIARYGVTSLAEMGFDVPMREVVDAVVEHAGATWSGGEVDRADVVWRIPHDDKDLAPFSRGKGAGERVRDPGPRRDGSAASVRLTGRLAEAGVEGGLAVTDPKPEWMKARVSLGGDVMSLRARLKSKNLVTVCEEAGCPNLSECWSDGTATFMVCGERCTRTCGFCLVDTRKPEALDAGEPSRVAEAVAEMGLDYAVITMVARDDLPDGGAAHVARTIEAIRELSPRVDVEALISDLKGGAAALETVLSAGPTVLNHNIETVARLQRAVRPSAAYARSLTVLARSSTAGVMSKSGLVVGMGETDAEIRQTLVDLHTAGARIVTIGQYLRPTTHHLPVERWWHPDAFAEWKDFGEDLGFDHVEASPLTRSSYHARSAAGVGVGG